jgi:hypothetical protein
MASNILSGPIPNTLREVKGLDALDLSSNQQRRKLSCKKKKKEKGDVCFKKKKDVCFILIRC